jgi:hypothetical protein
LKIINAPWTQEQVDHLNKQQQCGNIHPFTCGECSGDLIATKDGWWCPKHPEYKQTWAMELDLETMFM